MFTLAQKKKKLFVLFVALVVHSNTDNLDILMSIVIAAFAIIHGMWPKIISKINIFCISIERYQLIVFLCFPA